MFDHHELTKHSCEVFINQWQLLTTTKRCPACWLRVYECYCSCLKPLPGEVPYIDSIIIYYHFKELGRSSNTAHLLPLLLPHRQCRTITYGDSEPEAELMRQIVLEQQAGKPRTCIMYPSKDSPTLSAWLKQSDSSLGGGEGGGPSSASPSGINLVVVDGTSSQARRQVNHLEHMFRSVIPGECTSRLPLVKLDFEAIGGSCVSSLAKIRYQPSAEKICSMQAVILAMQEAGVPGETCAHLGNQLDAFLVYIMSKKVLKLEIIN